MRHGRNFFSCWTSCNIFAIITRPMCSKQILTRDNLRELVAAQYRDRPHFYRPFLSTALLSKHELLLTYAGLNGQIDRIGCVLRAHKLAQSDRVAIVLSSGREIAATFLGVACYSTCAPLNPAYGGGRTGVLLDRPRCQSGRDIGRDGTTAAKPCDAVR